MAMASAAPESRAMRLMIWTAFAIVAITDFGYWLIIRAQEIQPPDPFTFPFVATYVGLMAAMLGVSLLDRPLVARLRPALRAGAAAGLLVLGVLALTSIGILLLLASLIAAIAAVRSLGRFRSVTALSEATAVIVAVAVLITGFEVSERLIVCPPNGASTGGGAGFVTGPYHYECVNGQLHFHSGFCNGGSAGVDANGTQYATSNC